MKTGVFVKIKVRRRWQIVIFEIISTSDAIKISWWKFGQARNRTLLREERRGNRNRRISEKDRCARSEFLRGTEDPGRCRRSIRFLPCTLFLLRIFSRSNEREAVINTCVYSSTTFPPSSPPSSRATFVLKHPDHWATSRHAFTFVWYRQLYLQGRCTLSRGWYVYGHPFMKCALMSEKSSPSFLLEEMRAEFVCHEYREGFDWSRTKSSLVDKSLSATQSPRQILGMFIAWLFTCFSHKDLPLSK